MSRPEVAQPLAHSAPPDGMMSLGEALAMLQGAQGLGDVHVRGDAGLRFQRVHTDSRSLRPGDLFVALRGERFDGHDHLADAARAGAVAAMAERGLAEAGLSGLQVRDTLAGLQALAAAWRRRWQAGPLIGVTGSNGKTTVTQMIAAILRAAMGEAACATEGNFNNHIGVPLTLLRLRPGHRAAVLELGMNHPGEIAQLAQLCGPTVALVNNAQREHQEFMHSVNAVAMENGAVIESLPADGVAVFPADDPQAPVWRKQAGSRRVLSFALDGPADVVVRDAVPSAQGWTARCVTPAGEWALRLDVPGRHNLKNALAATAAALAAGVGLAAVQQGLATFRPVRGRSQVITLQRDGQVCTLIDDTYNANPDSVLAAIDVLAALPGPHWLILGDMGEVGTQGPAFHAEVGQRARQAGLAHLWCAGQASVDAARGYGAGARHFAGADELLAALAAQPGGDALPVAATILVKGSRFMRMERVVAALQSVDAATPVAGGSSCC
jgi:UDP-N-acetylmuramoyl-tripeptide--D-alanyl-D-alanine ligase